MADTITGCWTTWTANLSRQPREGERDEWSRVFGTTEPGILRRALDAYFASAPSFPVISDLRARVRSIAPRDSATADEARLRSMGPAAWGFRGSPSGPAGVIVS